MIDRFCSRLELSGYPVKIAAKIVLNGAICYEKKLAAAMKEGKTIHRSEDEDKVGRRKIKLSGMNNWFRPVKKKKIEDDEFHGGNGSGPRLRGAPGRASRSPGGGLTPSLGSGRKTTEAAIKNGPVKEVRVVAPLFVQASKNGRLAAMIREEDDKHD